MGHPLLMMQVAKATDQLTCNSPGNVTYLLCIIGHLRSIMGIALMMRSSYAEATFIQSAHKEAKIFEKRLEPCHVGIH